MRPAQLLLSLALASGCTAANPQLEPGLEEAVVVHAHGAQPGSAIVVHGQGALDPAGRQNMVAVRDVRATVDATGDRVRVQELTLTLGDTDMPPSATVPDGLKIRAQTLSIAAPMIATVRARGELVLALSLKGSMRYDSAMQLDDGSLYPLGATETFGELQLTIARKPEGGLRTRLDSQPDGACADVGGLLTLSDCAMSVETESTLAEIR